MNSLGKKILTGAISLVLAILLVLSTYLFIPTVKTLPETTGTMSYTTGYRDDTTGQWFFEETVAQIGEDVTALRVNDLADLGKITKVNYIPNEFASPSELPKNAQIVDLTQDFAFAEKGTLIFYILNLDPEDENFQKKADRLEKYKNGDYWNFTLRLPQIFSASNVYKRSELLAKNGAIENYDFIDFTTSDTTVTDAYDPHVEGVTIPLKFYTRREAMSNAYGAAQVITIHYQSDGTALSAVQGFPIIGTEDAVKSVEDQASISLLAALLLSAMAFAVLVVLSILKRTAHFAPELMIIVGALFAFLSEYLTATATGAPLFWEAVGGFAPFLLLAAVFLSIEGKLFRVPVKYAFAGLSIVGGILAFLLPYVPFAAFGGLGIAVNLFKAALVASILAFCVRAIVQRKATRSHLEIAGTMLVVVLTVTPLIVKQPTFMLCDPVFWLYAAIIAIAFTIVFHVFFENERENAYLTANLNMEVERQIKDVRAVISERDRLLQFISHDMKKPLSSSVVFLESLIKREKDDEQRKGLNVVKQNTEKVICNLTEIASYAHYNYFAEPSQAVNLRELCDNVFKYSVADCEAGGILLKNLVTDDYKVFAKRLGLENAITNIILNAVEHADCTEIELSVALDKNRVVLTVHDNGKGVAPDVDVFKPYVSENTSDTVGLGLYICKSIVESMNGELTLSNKKGGATFAIALLKA